MVAVIPRAAWGARYPNGFKDAPVPFSEWWLHHSVTVAPDLLPPFTDDDAAIRTLEAIGQQRFGGGISYTWAITPVGRVYEGHGVGRQGAHTGGRNDRARAIVFVGNYDVDRPTAAQIEAAAQLMVQEYRAGRATRYTLNGGHRQLKATSCPGDFAFAAIPVINARATALMRGAPARPIPEDDMPLTDSDLDKIMRRVWRGAVFTHPATGKLVLFSDAFAAMAIRSEQVAVDAAVARKLAEEAAKTGGALSEEAVQRFSEATAREVAEQIRAGYDAELTLTPKPDDNG